jgi:hypothetical protein
MMNLVVPFRNFADAPKERPRSTIRPPLPPMILHKYFSTEGTGLLCRYIFAFKKLVCNLYCNEETVVI